MAVSATIRVRAIPESELWEIVDLLKEMGKRVKVVEYFETAEEAPIR